MNMISPIRLSVTCASLLFLIPFLASAQKLKSPPAKPLDINSATAAQLEQVAGIGPSIAQSIVRTREKSGPYHRLEDLLVIRGISKQRLEKLRPYLTVSPPPVQ
jgi:competence ComEA-like helix-hairpin-helix protein